MEVSFIIITYQRGRLLQDCLDAVYQQTGLGSQVEVVVIDNAGDAQINPPPSSIFQLQVVRSEKNLGVAGGRNLGMQHARGEYLLFIDDDAIWHSHDDAARIMQHFRQNPRCGVVAVKSLKPDGTVVVSEYPHPNKTRIAAATEPTEVPYYYGVGHGLRASAVKQVGNYPERYFYSMEEVDLSLRIINAGYTIVYDPSIAVYHYHSALGRPTVGVKYWQRNMLNKCRVAWRLLPYRYLVSIFIIWSAALVIKTRQPAVLLKTWYELWRERSQLVSERNPVGHSTLTYLRRIGARLLY